MLYSACFSEEKILFSSQQGRLTWVFSLTGSIAGGCHVGPEAQ